MMLSENDTSTNWHRVLNPTIADHMLKTTIKLDIACSRYGSTYTRPDLTYDQALQHVFRYHLYKGSHQYGTIWIDRFKLWWNYP